MSTSPAEAIGNRAIVRRSFGQLADASLGVATTPVEVLNESQIEQGFAGLALLGNEPSMPLKVVKGKASLGFIPLGKIKPLD